MSDENFLSRWSRKKTESKSTSIAGTEGPAADVAPSQEGAQSPAPGPPPELAPEPLPPIESLTPDSDFTPFMKAEVEPGLKRDAFKKLIQDPRYNVMDGLDVYIDDYSKPDPLPEGWLEKMNQVKHLGIFQPPPEVPEDKAASQGATLQKPMEEQALATPAETPPADTLEADVAPPGVGKAGTVGEGL